MSPNWQHLWASHTPSLKLSSFMYTVNKLHLLKYTVQCILKIVYFYWTNVIKLLIMYFAKCWRKYRGFYCSFSQIASNLLPKIHITQVTEMQIHLWKRLNLSIIQILWGSRRKSSHFLSVGHRIMDICICISLTWWAPYLA